MFLKSQNTKKGSNIFISIYYPIKKVDYEEFARLISGNHPAERTNRTAILSWPNGKQEVSEY